MELNIVYNEDCLETMKRMPDKSVDLVLTDPPYGIGANKMTLGNGKRKIFRGNSDWDKKPPAQEIFDEIFRISKHQIIWGGNHLIEQIGKNSSCWFFWDKGTGDNDFADGELAYTSFKGALRKAKVSWVGANAKEKSDKDRFHPTQKPIKLMEWCLEYAKLGNNAIVYDPFMGSGTTAIACKSLGLDYIGSELDKDYFEIINKRLQSVQGSLF